MDKQEKVDKDKQAAVEKTDDKKNPPFSPKLVGDIADEVSKTLLSRLTLMLPRPAKRKKVKKTKKIDNAFFLDTSAIIDGRIFDVVKVGLLNGTVVLLPGVLLELKHLADSQDTVKRERGRKGLEALDKLKKSKNVKVAVLSDQEEEQFRKYKEVDEQLLKIAKFHKGKVITCDYNLEKKGSIENVVVINVNALANYLKVIAVPGESLHIKVSHQGKDPEQGVGYLDDGTMIVVERGVDFIGETIDVVVSRVIQTATGKILFAKKI